MILYWRKYDKEEREAKKRAEKEALEKRKRDEETREAKRQQRKLNFLITQTELFSHFLANKVAEGIVYYNAHIILNYIDSATAPPDAEKVASEILTKEDGGSDGSLVLLTFLILADESLKREAVKATEQAVKVHLDQMKAFDDNIAKLRAASEAPPHPQSAPLMCT
jgi:DNA helicase INO80